MHKALNLEDDIPAVLALLQQQDVLLYITINGQGETFTSSLLEVDYKEHPPALMITPLEPAAGNALIEQANSICVTFSLKNAADDTEPQNYTFNSIYICPATFLDDDCIKISYPDRRQYLRVTISPQEHIPVLIRSEMGAGLRGILYDLSPKGIGVHIHASEPPYELLDMTQTVHFTLPQHEDITSEIIVHYVKEDPEEGEVKGRKRFFYGAEFVNLNENMFDHIVSSVMQREYGPDAAESGLRGE